MISSSQFSFRCRSSDGYTIIETTVVIVLVALLAAFSFQAIIMATDTYLTATQEYLEIFQEGKTALEKMAREIKETDPGSVGFASGSVSFTKHTDHDTPEDSSLDVTFKQVGNTIERQTAAGDFTLTENVAGGSFSAAIDGNNVVTLNFTVAKGSGVINLRTAVLPRLPE